MKLISRLSLQLVRLHREDAGQDLVEYALLVGLLAVGVGLFAPELSESMQTIYSRVAAKLAAAAA